jgi:ubiquinone/menaquinone biosynthesis C-methylase UbiE
MPIEPVRRSKRQAQATYTWLSRWYDVAEDPAERRSRAMGLRLLHVEPGERILEIGFGTGHALVAMARGIGSSGTVYGIDVSRGMLTRTRARLQQAGLMHRVELVLGDGARLPYRDGCFDALFMSFVLELFDTPEIDEVLHECRRVLRHGGRLGVVSLASRSPGGVMPRLYTWLHRRCPTVVDCRPIPVHDALAGAGFQVEQTAPLDIFGLPVEATLARKQPGNAPKGRAQGLSFTHTSTTVRKPST